MINRLKMPIISAKIFSRNMTSMLDDFQNKDFKTDQNKSLTLKNEENNTIPNITSSVPDAGNENDSDIHNEEHNEEIEYYQEEAYSHDSIDDADDESSLTMEEKFEVLEKFHRQPENKDCRLKSLKEVYPDVEIKTEDEVKNDLH